MGDGETRNGWKAKLWRRSSKDSNSVPYVSLWVRLCGPKLFLGYHWATLLNTNRQLEVCPDLHWHSDRESSFKNQQQTCFNEWSRWLKSENMYTFKDFACWGGWGSSATISRHMMSGINMGVQAFGPCLRWRDLPITLASRPFTPFHTCINNNYIPKHLRSIALCPEAVAEETIQFPSIDCILPALTNLTSPELTSSVYNVWVSQPRRCNYCLWSWRKEYIEWYKGNALNGV